MHSTAFSPRRQMTTTDVKHLSARFISPGLSCQFDKEKKFDEEIHLSPGLLSWLHTNTESWPLTKTQSKSWPTSYWRYWKPLLCRLIIAKLGWMVFFPVGLCSWQPTKCSQLSVEWSLSAQWMCLGCTFGWLRPYSDDSMPWLISVDSLSLLPQCVPRSELKLLLLSSFFCCCCCCCCTSCWSHLLNAVAWPGFACSWLII